jgi:hypothetical protein
MVVFWSKPPETASLTLKEAKATKAPAARQSAIACRRF